ncbi:citrate lyase acyl carrier protein [uncultured Negativibacillus sp.]|uniref:citrate lyase acyl carrier protein n=1 Tax=uncultured Negativibacillus sp. TaxID=1980696 RepID=UPI0025CC2F58|nr:citrate lyase acyl carrier protein [uncultured Negativibacillus sp.]
MKITTSAVAGTLESSDVYVKVEPCDKLEIEIESVVYNQFAEEIKKSIMEVVEELGVDSGKISINDKGAIDCVIKARVETAIKRAGGEN